MQPVVHFEIPAENPERAAEFYRSVFDWVINHVKVGEMDYWMVLTTPADPTGKPTGPGINGGILKRFHPEQPCVNHIQVESLDAAMESVKSAGGEIVVPRMAVTGVGYIAFFKDLDKHIMGLFQPDPSAA